jgi:hypothetical protein
MAYPPLWLGPLGSYLGPTFPLLGPRLSYSPHYAYASLGPLGPINRETILYIERNYIEKSFFAAGTQWELIAATLLNQ